MKLRWQSITRTGCLLLAMVFGVHPAHGSPAENSKGVTSYHQLVSGDPDSYEAFDTTFLAWERPILTVSKHLSLCYPNQSEPLPSFELSLRDQMKESDHRLIALHIPCSDIEELVAKGIEPEDYSQLYIFQGFSAEPQAAIDFFLNAWEVIEATNKLTIPDVSILAELLGMPGSVSAVYDFGISDAGSDSEGPYLTFGIATDDDAGETWHRLVSARYMSGSLWIYERVKAASDSFEWDILDTKVHGLTLSLLDEGATGPGYASSILRRQSDMGEAYFFENVAFALRSEFEVNNFGFPILMQYWFEEKRLGYTVDIVDADSVSKEGDWLYFTKARFFSSRHKSEAKESLATNIPVVVKEQIKASCDRKVFTRMAVSLRAAGQKSEWSEMNTPFQELDRYAAPLVTVFCKALVSPEETASDKLTMFSSLYTYDIFGMPDYSTRAFRMWFEYQDHNAK